MSYEKPKCECGDDLIWWSQPTFTLKHKIGKNGRRCKKPYNMRNEGGGAYERLECPSCLKEYEIEHDNKDRVVRGDIWSNA